MLRALNLPRTRALVTHHRHSYHFPSRAFASHRTNNGNSGHDNENPNSDSNSSPDLSLPEHSEEYQALDQRVRKLAGWVKSSNEQWLYMLQRVSRLQSELDRVKREVEGEEEDEVCQIVTGEIDEGARNEYGKNIKDILPMKAERERKGKVEEFDAMVRVLKKELKNAAGKMNVVVDMAELDELMEEGPVGGVEEKGEIDKNEDDHDGTKQDDIKSEIHDEKDGEKKSSQNEVCDVSPFGRHTPRG